MDLCGFSDGEEDKEKKEMDKDEISPTNKSLGDFHLYFF